MLRVEWIARACVCVVFVIMVAWVNQPSNEGRGYLIPCNMSPVVQSRASVDTRSVGVHGTRGRVQQEHSAILGMDVFSDAWNNSEILKTFCAARECNAQWTFLNIGANDGCVSRGVSCDEANNLLLENAHGWLVDGSSLSALSEYYKGASFQAVENFYVGVNNVLDLLKSHAVPLDLHFIKLDIDRNDCEIMFVILSAGYAPIAIQAEYNPLFPPPVMYNWPHADWPSSPPQSFNECSLQYLTEMMRMFGYSLFQVDMWDAWFVRKEALVRANVTVYDPRVWWFQNFIRNYRSSRDILVKSAFNKNVAVFDAMADAGMDSAEQTFGLTSSVVLSNSGYPFLHFLPK